MDKWITTYKWLAYLKDCYKKGNEDILKDLLEGILEIPIEKVEVMQEVELERVDIKDKLGVY